MKNLLKLSLLSFVISAFSSTGFSLTDEEINCKQGQCVIFQVTISLDSQIESPVILKETEVIYIGGEKNEYDTVTTKAGNDCNKKVVVPIKVYRSITQILDSLDGHGEPMPTLTPAQQTILLFYTTLMEQTLSFTCKATDVGNTSNS